MQKMEVKTFRVTCSSLLLLPCKCTEQADTEHAQQAPSSKPVTTYNLLSSSTLLRSVVTWRRLKSGLYASQVELPIDDFQKTLLTISILTVNNLKKKILHDLICEFPTSYFCLFSLSIWSNFSASRVFIHSCSSLAFSL